MLLLKSPQNNVETNTSNLSYMSGEFWDKITNSIDEPAVQCDVPAVKNFSLVDGDDDDRN